MIDWGLAERVALMAAGGDGPPAREPANLMEAVRQASTRVSEYTGLVPATPLPRAEAIDRPEWLRANLASMGKLLDPALASAGDGLGPLRGPARLVGGAALGAEIGGLSGFLASRVLGQYDLVLLDPDAPARLLFVTPNLESAVRRLGVDRDEFVAWVALHEVTHALQFSGVPWLREHLAGIVKELLGGLEKTAAAKSGARLPSREELEGMVQALRRGDISQLIASPAQRELLERIQTLMAVVEGHAEHVMDAVGVELLPTLPQLRAALDRRRESQTGVAKLLSKLLGFDAKLRQYVEGKRFCDAVVDAEGAQALAFVWSSPEALPSPQELAAPASWLERTSTARGAA